ncbi:hypothetical protein KA012_00620 [Candidatus Woesebacteria bacterium]|nr:hypothetical protein [Candidatus Woesebacteria bacterium]
MHKPAQLSLEIFSLLILTLIATSQVRPAQAQVENEAAPAPEAILLAEPAEPVAAPTPEPLTLTSEADSALKLTATPIRAGDDGTLLLKPGEKKQITLKVYNNSKIPVKILSVVEDFVIGEDGASPQPVEESEADNRWSLKQWVTLVPNSQTIPAEGTGALSVLIEVPDDALPGGHYAMVMHQPDLGNKSLEGEAKNTAINQRVGTLLYVVVDGPMIEEAFIRELIIPGFQEFGPVPYSFTIDNDSDTHIQPKLTFNVYNIWGKRIYSDPIPSKNIFPKDSRSFDEGTWDRIWGFGRYKGEVVAVYGSQSATKILSTFFWVFPLKLALATGAGVIALIGMIISVRRHLIHRSQDQSKRVRELEEKVALMEQEKSTSPQADE